MINDTPSGKGHGAKANNAESSNFTVKAGLAQMLKGGVIMDVVNVEQVYQSESQSRSNEER